MKMGTRSADLDLLNLKAAELAARFRKRELSSVDAISAFLERRGIDSGPFGMVWDPETQLWPGAA